MDLTDLAPTEAPARTRAAERLLAAAGELFYDRGIGAVGVDLVAETAGVTKRTLYQRYGSKNHLVLAYLQERANRWQRFVLAELASPRAGGHPVSTVFTAADRWSQTNPRGCAFVNAWAELGGTGHPAVATVAAEKLWMRTLFGRLTCDADTAPALHLLYEGAQVARTTLGDARAFTRADAAALQLLGVPTG